MFRNAGLAALAVLAVILWTLLLVRPPGSEPVSAPAGASGPEASGPTRSAPSDEGSDEASDAGEGSGAAEEPDPVARAVRRLVRDDETTWRLLVLGDGTGDGEGEWVRLLAERIAAETGRPVFSRTWSVAAGDYTEPVTVSEGGGAPVEVFNASAAGEGPAYSRENLETMAPPEPADLVVVNHGHNTPDPDTAVAEVGLLLDAVRDRWADAGLAVVLQNPRLDGAAERQRRVVRSLRRELGGADVLLVPVHGAFRRTDGVPALIGGSVVPNAEGSQLWAETAWESFGPGA